MANKIMVFARPNGNFNCVITPIAAAGDIWDMVGPGTATVGYCNGDDGDLAEDADDEVPPLSPGLWVHDDIDTNLDGFAMLPDPDDGWRRPTPEELARYVAGEPVFVEDAGEGAPA